jgi:Cu+-exporting ATPase
VASTGDFLKEHSSKGATVIAFARDQQVIALIALRDQLKPGAKEVLESLKKMGLSVAMVSGDNRQTAEAISSELGIPKSATHAETSPEKKADLIEALQQSGQAVCFVGDGINDAPALEKADLGIAVRAASDIAKESADIILLQSDIQAIPQALTMSRATLRTIKQNLFWAFFYNSIGIPLAALGFLSPLLCAAAMGFSDLVVVGNALRLRFRRF